MGRLRHGAMSTERNDEVRPCARQHLAVVGEYGRIAEGRGSLGGDVPVGVLEADQLHVGHFGGVAEVGRVIE